MSKAHRIIHIKKGPQKGLVSFVHPKGQGKSRAGIPTKSTMRRLKRVTRKGHIKM